MKYINLKIKELTNLISDIDELKKTFNIDRDYKEITTCDMLIREFKSQLASLQYIIQL